MCSFSGEICSEKTGFSQGRLPKGHPSYSLDLTRGGSAYCSIDFVYQVMNKTHEIYKRPIGKTVSDRKRINGLNRIMKSTKTIFSQQDMGFLWQIQFMIKSLTGQTQYHFLFTIPE